MCNQKEKKLLIDRLAHRNKSHLFFLPLPGGRGGLRLISKHGVLNAQVAITRSLKQTARLERPRNLVVGLEEEESHLEGVAEQPIGQDGDSEADAGAPALVGEDLRKRKDSFDGECNVSLRRNVQLVAANNNLQTE